MKTDLTINDIELIEQSLRNLASDLEDLVENDGSTDGMEYDLDQIGIIECKLVAMRKGILGSHFKKTRKP